MDVSNDIDVLRPFVELHDIEEEEVAIEEEVVEEDVVEEVFVGGVPDEVLVGDVVKDPLDEIEGHLEVVEAPRIGMVFNTLQALEDFYCKYGEASGFGVIRRAGYVHRVTKEKRRQYWHCDRGPFTKQVNPAANDGKLTRRRKSKKCGCGAGITGGLTNEGLWEIQQVEITHTNHIINPALSRFIPKYRKIPKHLLRLIKDLLDAGVKQSQIYAAIANQLNGFDKIPFLLKDLNALVQNERGKKFKDGDCEAMFEYFEKMREANGDFFYSWRKDEDDRLKDLVWIDSRSLAAYKDFSDVVCFDATYITNNYELPFANFVGVNHHGQTILLGCALITTEDTETYKWVMSEWLRGMGGKKPGGIITDQSTPMRNAIKEVLVGTKHRLCVWHILTKVPQKFAYLPELKEFHQEMRAVVYDSLSTGEFEDRWNEMIKSYNLESNEWLKGLYSDRKWWVPAFVKDYFWAGMSTTQRVESIHHFFKGFMNAKTRLREFVQRYSRAIDHRSNSEKLADSLDERRKTRLQTSLMVEKFFSKIYTDAKLKEVQEECRGLIHCVPNGQLQKSPDVWEYLIEDRIWFGEHPCYEEKRNLKVEHNKEEESFHCDCRLFQHRGILCRHIIRVIDMVQLKIVPEKYVLDRWRKDIKRKHVSITVAFNDPRKTVEQIRYGKLQYEFQGVFEKAMESDELFEYASSAAKRLIVELEGVVNGASVGGNTCNRSGTNVSQPTQTTVRDPKPVARVGRPRKKVDHGPAPKRRRKSKASSDSVSVPTQGSVTQPQPQPQPQLQPQPQPQVVTGNPPNLDLQLGLGHMVVGSPCNFQAGNGLQNPMSMMSVLGGSNAWQGSSAGCSPWQGSTSGVSPWQGSTSGVAPWQGTTHGGSPWQGSNGGGTQWQGTGGGTPWQGTTIGGTPWQGSNGQSGGIQSQLTWGQMCGLEMRSSFQLPQGSSVGSGTAPVPAQPTNSNYRSSYTSLLSTVIPTTSARDNVSNLPGAGSPPQ